jgi:hypothetical protein
LACGRRLTISDPDESVAIYLFSVVKGRRADEEEEGES